MVKSNYIHEVLLSELVCRSRLDIMGGRSREVLGYDFEVRSFRHTILKEVRAKSFHQIDFFNIFTAVR